MEADAANYGTIFQLERTLNKIQDFDILLERILLEARKIVRADAGSIYVRENIVEKGNPIEKLAIKYSQNDTLSARLPKGERLIYSLFSVPINKKTISGYCALTRHLVNIPDMYNIEKEAPYSFNPEYDIISNYKTISTLTVPLIDSNDQLIGVIQVINSRNESGEVIPFSQSDEAVISHFAITSSMALQWSHSTRVMVLRTVKMAELRDPKETGVHVNRVASYAVEIYARWSYFHKIPAVQREKVKDILRTAAMLHDVGKVAIPDAILKKPGRFNDEEYRIMQWHTVYGASLFSDSHSPLDEISRDIALTHHENWDGTGYPGWFDPVAKIPIKTDENGTPLGKKGKEIPLAGRIVALADVFDALCSRRVYKEPWGDPEVLSEMKKMRGTKFDPELTDIFFDIYPSIKRIQTMYTEDETT
ncbi:MAG: HD-GYP domain-containing protein [Treponema sp.]|jgi:HD-GYP domain-containing protein (c-di-GMP phosphodiesterase class II)|nr:HD-GYP domain-containing protein [Treponema sp.]